VLRAKAKLLERMLRDPRGARVRRYLSKVAMTAARTRKKDLNFLEYLNRRPSRREAEAAGTEQTLKQLERRNWREVVDRYIDGLDDGDRSILRWRFGLDSRSQSDLAANLKVSRQKIGRRLEQMLSELKAMHRAYAR
jgi:DNA-directed RNA polymerase specialized sigma subunit